VVLQAGCVGMGDDADYAEITQEANVAWTSLVGVQASGNDLTKSSAVAQWSAGAISTTNIPTSGFFEFSTNEANTAKMAGLANGNTNQHYNDIAYAIHLKPNAGVSVREAGVHRGDFGTYMAGDLFRVTTTGAQVTYSKNGVVFYTSAVAPTMPLLVDTSFLTPGGTITDAQIVTGLTWANVVGVATTEDSLTKIVINPPNGGAASNESITGAGYVEFSTGETNTTKMAGLANGDTNQHHADIDYAVHLKSDGTVRIYEFGTLRGGSFGAYVPSDVFRVEANGAVVTYSKNGVVFYTSSVAPTYPLRVDTSLRTNGATLTDITLQQL
jgi:hypothetical protein